MTTTATQPARVSMLEEIGIIHAGGKPLPPLNIDQIDACCIEYELAQRDLETATAKVQIAKQAMIALVQAHGNVPTGAEKSRRILGRRSIATITTGDTINVREEGVAALEEYLDKVGLETLFHQLFVTNTKHSLQKSAHDVLRNSKLRKPEAEKIEAIFGSCIDVRPKAPSLKVESIVPEKPERKPRAGKAVA